MSQTLLERIPTIDQMNKPSLPQQKESHVHRAKSILIVEDDSGIRDLLGEIFQEETIHRIYLAPDGETALSMLATATPTLLLLDYNLASMNGLELVDHIRRIKGYEHTPVILMSASLSQGDITGQHLRYLQKPFDLERLLQMVEEVYSQ